MLQKRVAASFPKVVMKAVMLWALMDMQRNSVLARIRPVVIGKWQVSLSCSIGATSPRPKISFPEKLLEEFIKRGELPGVLGNCKASGTEIIAELGEEHMRTGKPIVYTSADSVFQIACHEQSFGLERLLALSQLARETGR